MGAASSVPDDSARDFDPELVFRTDLLVLQVDAGLLKASAEALALARFDKKQQELQRLLRGLHSAGTALLIQGAATFKGLENATCPPADLVAELVDFALVKCAGQLIAPPRAASVPSAIATLMLARDATLLFGLQDFRLLKNMKLEDRRADWKSALKSLRRVVARSPELKEAQMPCSLLLQLIFSLDVAVASLPDPNSAKKLAGSVGNVLMGTVKAASLGNPAQLVQGLGGLAGSALGTAERMYADFYRKQLFAFVLRPHQDPISGTGVKRELARLWNSLTEGSHRWEIQAAFVCMVTEVAIRLIDDRNEADPGNPQVDPVHRGHQTLIFDTTSPVHRSFSWTLFKAQAHSRASWGCSAMGKDDACVTGSFGPRLSHRFSPGLQNRYATSMSSRACSLLANGAASSWLAFRMTSSTRTLGFKKEWACS